MVSVALRAWDEVLAAIEKETVPVPVPLAPEVRVIQLALLVAVHVHELADGVTVTLRLLIPDPTERLVADTA